MYASCFCQMRMICFPINLFVLFFVVVGPGMQSASPQIHSTNGYNSWEIPWSPCLWFCGWQVWFQKYFNYFVIVSSVKWKHNVSPILPLALQALTSVSSSGMLQLNRLLCRWGRKRSITISCIMYIIAGPVAAYTPHYLVFYFARLALGMAGAGTYNCGFTLCK